MAKGTCNLAGKVSVATRTKQDLGAFGITFFLKNAGAGTSYELASWSGRSCVSPPAEKRNSSPAAS